MFILFVILIIAIVWAYFKYIKKPIYRIALTDPITGYIKYLSKVDGINGSFEYSRDEKDAITFVDVSRAVQFIKGVNDNASPTIQYKKILNWQKYNG